jgi:hypothetical protein
MIFSSYETLNKLFFISISGSNNRVKQYDNHSQQDRKLQETNGRKTDQSFQNCDAKEKVFIYVIVITISSRDR